MTFRDAAIAAHEASLKAAQDRQAAVRTDAVAAARIALVPVLSDGGKVLLDPKTLITSWVSPDAATVVMSTPGADPLSFAVRGGVVSVTWQDAGAWVSSGPKVTSAAEVGAYLAKDA